MEFCPSTGCKRWNSCGQEIGAGGEPKLKRAKIADEQKPKIEDDRGGSDDEESHFLRLCTLILNCIITIKGVSDMDIMVSVDAVIALFRSHQFSKIDFTKWANVCAYLYRYGSHGAGFVRCRVLQALKHCDRLRPLVKTSDLRVVCLGTGPGNDAVGLCSALSEFQFLDKLAVTVVDKFKEWSLCIELAKVLVREEKLGKVSELFERCDVAVAFVQVDLPGDPVSDKRYFQRLGEADIILISKLFSCLDTRIAKDVIQSLKENMKKEAFIFLNDSFIPSHWKTFEVLYTWGTDAKDEYKSSAHAKRRFGSNDNVVSNLPINVLNMKH